MYDLDVQKHVPVWDLDRGMGVQRMYIWYIKVVCVYFLGPIFSEVNLSKPVEGVSASSVLCNIFLPYTLAVCNRICIG